MQFRGPHQYGSNQFGWIVGLREDNGHTKHSTRQSKPRKLATLLSEQRRCRFDGGPTLTPLVPVTPHPGSSLTTEYRSLTRQAADIMSVVGDRNYREHTNSLMQHMRVDDGLHLKVNHISHALPPLAGTISAR
eukprot:TRINITY_DN59120_c0_g1_i1.p1 TRINITY_DN59120_c0_g1~~TRINITY_DN59120_c0_g1_i1.p1  ORF type:complete len:133 (-),score=14.08 TRINITY_DN59120_c0_g1_i1:277-675(-)